MNATAKTIQLKRHKPGVYSTSIKGTNYSINRMRTMDGAPFAWRVTSYSVANHGTDRRDSYFSSLTRARSFLLRVQS